MKIPRRDFQKKTRRYAIKEGNKRFAGIILAAGESTRMKSDKPKVLHTLLGRPMLDYVIQSVRDSGADRILVVIGFEGNRVADTFKDSGVEFVIQKERLGTAHAVIQTSSALSGFDGDCLILCGDTPLIQAQTVKKILTKHFKEGAGLTLLTANLSNPAGYGRILRDNRNRVYGIVEDKDATLEQKGITEINTGVYCFKTGILFDLLSNVGRDNKQGEYYLTDCVGLAKEAGITIADYVVPEPEEIVGVNTMEELAKAEELLKKSLMIKVPC
ncbi:NTP transferase domain-containing protein [bacterium]|nr:NTP transferase domain-containing protein [bacterium]